MWFIYSLSEQRSISSSALFSQSAEIKNLRGLRNPPWFLHVSRRTVAESLWRNQVHSVSLDGELRPALLHNWGSASSTTATIKQPALGTETGPDTLSHLPPQLKVRLIYKFIYQHFSKSTSEPKAERRLVFLQLSTPRRRSCLSAFVQKEAAFPASVHQAEGVTVVPLTSNDKNSHRHLFWFGWKVLELCFCRPGQQNNLLMSAVFQ